MCKAHGRTAHRSRETRTDVFNFVCTCAHEASIRTPNRELWPMSSIVGFGVCNLVCLGVWCAPWACVKHIPIARVLCMSRCSCACYLPVLSRPPLKSLLAGTLRAMGLGETTHRPHMTMVVPAACGTFLGSITPIFDHYHILCVLWGPCGDLSFLCRKVVAM